MTQQRRDFAHALFLGKNQAEAYRSAFGAEGKTEASIRSMASRLSKDVNVLAYLAEMNAEMKHDKILSKEQLAEWLTLAIVTPLGEIAEGSQLAQSVKNTPDEQSIKAVSKLEAAKELGKLMGYYPSSRLELTGKDGSQLLPAKQLDGELLAAVADKVAAARKRLDADE